MTTDSACLLDKELEALPRLNTVRLQFRPSRSDIGYLSLDAATISFLFWQISWEAASCSSTTRPYDQGMI